MVDETTAHAEIGQVAVLQLVVRAEDDRRRPGQFAGAHAVGEMPGDERRAGQPAIAHRPQRHAAAAGHRARAGADATSHLAGAHALEADFLVFHHHVQQYPALGAEVAHRGSPPGRQAVGIERQAQALDRAALVQHRHPLLQVAFQQAHLLHMVEQTLAQFGRLRARRAHQHRLADPCFEQFDALGNRRLRQPQRLGAALEAALLHHGGQGSQQLVVEHNQFS
ncbi:hypothetical protein D3C78_854390 [compost metagenome]